MPLVIVMRKPIISDARLDNVLDLLPNAVAQALSFGEPESDTQLTANEIEVWVFDGHKKNRGTKDIEILIFAHDYPERRENLETRRQAIQAQAEAGLIKYATGDPEGFDPYTLAGWVWPFLGHTDFGRLFGRQK